MWPGRAGGDSGCAGRGKRWTAAAARGSGSSEWGEALAAAMEQSPLPQTASRNPAVQPWEQERSCWRKGEPPPAMSEKGWGRCRDGKPPELKGRGRRAGSLVEEMDRGGTPWIERWRLDL